MRYATFKHKKNILLLKVLPTQLFYEFMLINSFFSVVQSEAEHAVYEMQSVCDQYLTQSTIHRQVTSVCGSERADIWSTGQISGM